MVTVDLITGFLGSGKTTFLLKYAKKYIDQGFKIGILEYDYGAINIDMLLLGKLRGEKCELEMLSAACDEDCLRRRFKTKLISMAMSGYDRVIIEPSGIFDMDQFFDTLRDEPLDNWYEIGNVITVVNANLSEDMTREEDFYLASQAASAGIILLSRTQLSTAEQIENTKFHLARACEEIRCNKYKPQFIEKDWDELDDNDYVLIDNCGYNVNDYIKAYSGANIEFSNVCFLNLDYNLEDLKDKVRSLYENSGYGNIIRVKGFIHEKGQNYLVNCTKYELTMEPTGVGGGTIIVIGTNLNEEKIRELIEEKNKK